jgi:hypothetical protein
MLVYESDLFSVLCDSMRDSLGSQHAIGSVLKWCLKFCDEELVRLANPRIIGLIHALLSVMDEAILSLGATSMLYFLRKSDCRPAELLPRSFFELLLNLPDDFEGSLAVFCLLNGMILADLGFFADFVLDLPIVEWILKGLALRKGQRFSMRILGNLAHHEGYCEYFKTHCFCEILFNLEPFDFAANDDFFIFVCRMACYDCFALWQVRDVPVVLERLLGILNSDPKVGCPAPDTARREPPTPSGERS